MRSKLWVAAAAGLGLLALGSSASAQIIATSIPREAATGAGKAAAEKKYAFHLFASPLAKWKINVFDQSEAGDVVLAQSANPNSKFLAAGEIAFQAGTDLTVGVGGWFNKVGSTNYDYVFVDVSGTRALGLEGVRTDDLTYTEGHVNAFYRDFGLQFGFVRSKATTSNLTISTFLLDDVTFSRAQLVALLGSGTVSRIESDARGTEVSATDTDGYLIYKTGSHKFNPGTKVPWTLSAGSGFYRYAGTKKTVFSGFVTGSVDVYKGLGLDVSFWYIGKSKSDIQELLGVADNLSRFSIGIGYTFSR